MEQEAGEEAAGPLTGWHEFGEALTGSQSGIAAVIQKMSRARIG